MAQSQKVLKAVDVQFIQVGFVREVETPFESFLGLNRSFCSEFCFVCAHRRFVLIQLLSMCASVCVSVCVLWRILWWGHPMGRFYLCGATRRPRQCNCASFCSCASQNCHGENYLLLELVTNGSDAPVLSPRNLEAAVLKFSHVLQHSSRTWIS